MKWLKKLLLPLMLLVSTLGFSATEQAQSFEPSFKEVSLATLNIHLDIPVIYKQGVKEPFTYGLHFNNNFWTTGGDAATWTPGAFGWQGVSYNSFDYSSSMGGGWDWDPGCGGGYGENDVQTLYGYVDPSGSYHILQDANHHPRPVVLHPGGGAYQGCQTINGYNFTFNDGSGITINARGGASGVTGTVIYPDGSVITPSVTAPSVSDTNGNTVSLSYGSPTIITDTLGVPELSISGAVPGPVTYTYPTSTGTVYATANYSYHQIRTNFGCTGINEANPTTALLLDNLTLADGSAYVFTYESQVANSVTGRLASVHYPDGNTVSYTYPGTNHGVSCTGGGGSMVALTRTDVFGDWAFTVASNVTTLVSPAPANNKTVYTFSYNVGMVTPTQIQSYQGSSTLLKTDVMCYNNVLTNCATTTLGPTVPITQVDTYTTLAGMSTFKRTTVKYDTYSNVTETDVYDFGAASPTFKTTRLNYGKSWNGSISSPACTTIGNGVNNVPCQVEKFDANNNPIGNEFFSYNAQGNATQDSKWASGTITGGTYLSTSSSRNADGTPNVVTDFNGNQFTNSYGDCNGHMLTHIAGPLLNNSFIWDCNIGKITSATGQDQQTTLISFADPLLRPTSRTDPASTVTNVQYMPGDPNNTDVWQESTTNFNAGQSVSDIFTAAWPNASLSQSKEGPSSSTWDTTNSSSSWDATGLEVFTYSPCAVAQWSTCSHYSSTTHDALDRTLVTTDAGGGTTTYVYNGRDVLTTRGPAPAGEVVKKVQTEYDAFGRIMSVCQLSSATGGKSCGQDTAASGFPTVFTYNLDGTLASVARQTSTQTQTHSFTYDVAGRVLTATYPESGTIQSFYDSAPSTPGVSCGTQPNVKGKLAKTYDANGNTSCYYYDGEGRNIAIGYSGPNFDNISCKYFVYDSATVNGVVMSNTTGRLAEAYTQPCTGGSKTTDEGFSYDVLGRLTDVYQATPHSGGYYHTTATYFENGEVKTLNGIPGVGVTFTYSIDGKGRPLSDLLGTTHIINSVSYNAADRPCLVTLGTLDTNTYTYDGNPCTSDLVTGRMTQYNFTIGSTPKSFVGTLTWNQNGTLRQNAIVDGIGGVNQTCNYGTASQAGYDELGRLLHVDCGASIWQQDFSYDPFDNLTTSVPTGGTGAAWNPGYNPANNHYTLGGTSYDTKGESLNDSFHTYTWSQDGKLSGVTDLSETLTYDALGRMVEKNVGGVFTQILYSPVGRLAIMNGQTTSAWFISTPGGGKYEKGGSWWHPDWLGNVRLVSGSGRGMYAEREFSPYGETYKSLGTASEELSFTGDLQDSIPNSATTTNGVYDTPNRELSTVGRWLTPDPAGAGWNLYAYVGNDPLSNVDPLGLGTCPPGKGGDYDCHPTSGGDPVDALNNSYMQGWTTFGSPVQAGFNNNFGLQAEMGYVRALFAPPSGPGWVPAGGDYTGTGCLRNADKVWCPPVGGYHFLPAANNIPTVSQWRPPKSKDFIKAPPGPYKPSVVQCVTAPNDTAEQILGNSVPIEHNPAATSLVYQSTSRGNNPTVSPETPETTNGFAVFFASAMNMVGCLFNARSVF